MLQLFALLGLLAAQGSAQIPYRAAVVEQTGVSTNQTTLEGARKDMLKNVKTIDSWARTARGAGVDILVFSEDFVVGGVGPQAAPYYAEPMPEAGLEDLCARNDPNIPITTALACAARKHHVIIVTGMASRGPCVKKLSPFTKKPFPCDKATNTTWFNTMAAFGIYGNLLAKYHKSHLARSYHKEFEPQWAEAETPDPVMFESHFGVTFGMFICMDIQFGGPARALLANGVKDFVFSTFWMNKSPDQMALTYQDGFSRAHGVNVIAANGAYGGRVTSGSGIFPADTMAEFMQVYETSTSPDPTGWMGFVDLQSPESAHALLPDAAYPKDVGNSVSEGKRGEILMPQTGQTIKLTQSVGNAKCTLEAVVKKGGGQYLFKTVAVVAESGVYSEGCVLSACQEPYDSPESCEYVPEDKIKGGSTVFESVKISFETAYSNTWRHSALCEGGLLPEERSVLSMKQMPTTDGKGELVLEGMKCPLLVVMVDGRAQSENETVFVPPRAKRVTE